MSNYDVIESYIIDFTTFNNRDDAIINNNKFVFTGNVVVGINYERIVSGVKEYSGMSIGNGKIAIGIPGTDKSIVLEANDIETFKQSLVK